jgi:hypothetical protein
VINLERLRDCHLTVSQLINLERLI